MQIHIKHKTQPGLGGNTVITKELLKKKWKRSKTRPAQNNELAGDSMRRQLFLPFPIVAVN